MTGATLATLLQVLHGRLRPLILPVLKPRLPFPPIPDAIVTNLHRRFRTIIPHPASCLVQESPQIRAHRRTYPTIQSSLTTSSVRTASRVRQHGERYASMPLRYPPIKMAAAPVGARTRISCLSCNRTNRRKVCVGCALFSRSGTTDMSSFAHCATAQLLSLMLTPHRPYAKGSQVTRYFLSRSSRTWACNLTPANWRTFLGTSMFPRLNMHATCQDEDEDEYDTCEVEEGLGIERVLSRTGRPSESSRHQHVG